MSKDKEYLQHRISEDENHHNIETCIVISVKKIWKLIDGGF
jgi:hypothetical protein